MTAAQALGITEPLSEKTHRLSDGRFITWYEWGTSPGTPVLFCTGAGMGGCMGFGTHLLDKLNVRLIGVDRPGLGHSTLDPAKSLITWIDDVRQLLASMKLHSTRVGAVGFSQGSPFALSLASANLVDSVALVAAQDDMHHPQIRSQLDHEVAGMLDAIAVNRAEFEAEFTQLVSPEGLWQLIFGMSHPQDQQFYQQPAFLSAYNQALSAGFSQGPEGYVKDLLIAMAPWPFVLEEITARVDLWYGAKDVSTVHSPDHGKTLAARLKHASRVLEPNEGGAILWTRAEAILTKLLQSLNRIN